MACKKECDYCNGGGYVFVWEKDPDNYLWVYEDADFRGDKKVKRICKMCGGYGYVLKYD